MVPFLIAGHILLMWYHNLVTTLWPHCDNLVLTVIKIFVKDNEFYCVHGPLYIYVYRLVVDEWLELKFPSPETGQGVLSAVQTLRSMWSHLLEMKLQASQCESSNTSIKELAHNHARNYCGTEHDSYTQWRRWFCDYKLSLLDGASTMYVLSTIFFYSSPWFLWHWFRWLCKDILPGRDARFKTRRVPGQFFSLHTTPHPLCHEEPPLQRPLGSSFR